MSDNLQKIIFYAIAAISIILAGLFYFGGTDIIVYDAQEYNEPVFTNWALYWAYFLVAIAAVTSIVFSILQIVKNPKVIKQVLLIILGVVVVVAITYFLLSSTKALDLTDIVISDKGLKWVDTGLYITYFLIAIAFLSLIYSAVAKLFK